MSEASLYRDVCDEIDIAKQFGLEVWPYCGRFNIKVKSSGGPHISFDTIAEVRAYLRGCAFAKVNL